MEQKRRELQIYGNSKFAIMGILQFLYDCEKLDCNYVIRNITFFSEGVICIDPMTYSYIEDNMLNSARNLVF